jgi:hypothetical protein
MCGLCDCPSADLLEGACVESCPASMTASGIGDFKRRCMEPFACANGRIQGQDVAFGCKCSTDDMTPAACQMCEFRADEFGQHCTRCNGGMVSCGLLAAHTSTLNVQQCCLFGRTAPIVHWKTLCVPKH